MCVHFKTEEEYVAYYMDRDHTAALRDDKLWMKQVAARAAKRAAAEAAATPALTPAEKKEKATFEMELRQFSNNRKFAMASRG